MAEGQADEEEYMTTSEAARYLSLSERMVRKLNTLGDLPALTSSQSGYRLFTKANLDKYKADRARNPRRVGRPRKVLNQNEEDAKQK